MTQREFEFERASVEAHLQRIELSDAERRLLVGLVRFYFACRDTSDGRGIRCEDGRVLVEPSKEDLSALLRCSVPTVKRLLRDTRDTAAYILIETATHRTHCYTIDFPGLYAAPQRRCDPPPSAPKQGDHRGGSCSPRRGITAPQKGDHDPGSWGSKGGIMTRDHRGGKGGLHSISSGMNEMNSMESMEGDGISKKFSQEGKRSAWWWGRELSDDDFRDPDRMQELFERARELGLVSASEQDRVCWFALLVHYGSRKKLRNRPAVLTANMRRGTDGLGRPWRTIPTADDEEAARKLIRNLDYPPLDEWEGEEYDLYDLPLEQVAVEVAPAPHDPERTLPPEIIQKLQQSQAAAKQRMGRDSQ